MNPIETEGVIRQLELMIGQDYLRPDRVPTDPVPGIIVPTGTGVLECVICGKTFTDGELQAGPGEIESMEGGLAHSGCYFAEFSKVLERNPDLFYDSQETIRNPLWPKSNL